MSVNSIFAWVGSYLGSCLLAPGRTTPMKSDRLDGDFRAHLYRIRNPFGQNAMPLQRHAAPSLGHLSAYEQIGSPGTFP